MLGLHFLFFKLCKACCTIALRRLRMMDGKCKPFVLPHVEPPPMTLKNQHVQSHKRHIGYGILSSIIHKLNKINQLPIKKPQFTYFSHIQSIHVQSRTLRLYSSPVMLSSSQSHIRTQCSYYLLPITHHPSPSPYTDKTQANLTSPSPSPHLPKCFILIKQTST